MSHSEFRNRLVALANENSNNPEGFLEGLSPIHVDWHSEPVTYGFLLFHHRVVRYFNAIVNGPLNLNLKAYTPAELQGMSVVESPGTGGVDTLGELASYSARIQGWHNTAHGQIGTATGVPMMDPAQNIFFAPFWRLHLHIDERFVTCLRQYANKAHPGQLIGPNVIASHLETAHHTWVPRI